MPGKIYIELCISLVCFFSGSNSEFILLSYLIEHSPCDTTELSALNEEAVVVVEYVYSFWCWVGATSWKFLNCLWVAIFMAGEKHKK